MPRYHVNPESQRPNICRATGKRGCLYAAADGTEPPHFPTKEVAKAWVEEESAKEAGGSFSQGMSKKKHSDPSKERRRGDSRDAASITPVLPPLTEEHLEEMARSTPRPVYTPPRVPPAPKGMSSVRGEHISLKKVKDIMEEYNTSGDMLYEPGSLKVMHLDSGLTIMYRDVNSGDPMIYKASYTGETFLRNEPDGDYQELVDHVISEEFPREDPHASPAMKLSPEERAAEHVFNLAGRIEARSPGDWEGDPHAVAISYLGEGYRDMNRALKGGRASEALLNSLDAFSKEHVLEEDTVVYRGLRARGEDAARASLDAERRGLISTSTNAGTAVAFSGNREGSTVMRMLLPKGTRCRIVGGHESEIILPRDAKLENVEMIRLTRHLKTR